MKGPARPTLAATDRIGGRSLPRIGGGASAPGQIEPVGRSRRIEPGRDGGPAEKIDTRVHERQGRIAIGDVERADREPLPRGVARAIPVALVLRVVDPPPGRHGPAEVEVALAAR
jgi:hypothetical protein